MKRISGASAYFMLAILPLLLPVGFTVKQAALATAPSPSANRTLSTAGPACLPLHCAPQPQQVRLGSSIRVCAGGEGAGRVAGREQDETLAPRAAEIDGARVAHLARGKVQVRARPPPSSSREP